MPLFADLQCFSFPNKSHFLTPNTGDIVVFSLTHLTTLGLFYVLRAMEALKC